MRLLHLPFGGFLWDGGSGPEGGAGGDDSDDSAGGAEGAGAGASEADQDGVVAKAAADEGAEEHPPSFDLFDPELEDDVLEAVKARLEVEGKKKVSVDNPQEVLHQASPQMQELFFGIRQAFLEKTQALSVQLKAAKDAEAAAHDVRTQGQYERAQFLQNMVSDEGVQKLLQPGENAAELTPGTEEWVEEKAKAATVTILQAIFERWGANSEQATQDYAAQQATKLASTRVDTMNEYAKEHGFGDAPEGEEDPVMDGIEANWKRLSYPKGVTDPAAMTPEQSLEHMKKVHEYVLFQLGEHPSQKAGDADVTLLRRDAQTRSRRGGPGKAPVPEITNVQEAADLADKDEEAAERWNDAFLARQARG